jgi:hypothetical protein
MPRCGAACLEQFFELVPLIFRNVIAGLDLT